MLTMENPAAIFSAEGLKIFIEAIKSANAAATSKGGENAAVDQFLDGYFQHKESEKTPKINNNADYQAAYKILADYEEPMASAEIRELLKSEYGIEKTAQGFGAFMNAVLKRHPIIRVDRGIFQAKGAL